MSWVPQLHLHLYLPTSGLIETTGAFEANVCGAQARLIWNIRIGPKATSSTTLRVLKYPGIGYAEVL